VRYVVAQFAVMAAIVAAWLVPLRLDGVAPPRRTDLETVGRINDLAYGNVDGRLERTLASLPPAALRAYSVDHRRAPAAVALALYHDGDCGISFVATVPGARRRGLATAVMLGAMRDALEHGCTTVSLQATAQGERLYEQLGLRHLGPMELWERR
jgi:ribosomal protein S18 acetylase RimI-like enzyme